MHAGSNGDWKQLILDHYKNPRFFGTPAVYRLAAEEHNRTCGDHVTVYLSGAPEQGSFAFTGAGCSLCIASASLMVSLLQEVDLGASRAALKQFQEVWDQGAAAEAAETWQLIAALRQYPVRSRCVRLPWQALEKITEDWQGESE